MGHQVGDRAAEVGPGLSDTGGKLSRQSVYVSILDPSAAITHNYQSYLIELDNGLVETGLLVNQTDHSLTIKSAQGVLKSFPLAEVEAIEPSPVLLMPDDLQQLLTTDELIDVVEYLTALKSGSNPAAETHHLVTAARGNDPQQLRQEIWSIEMDCLRPNKAATNCCPIFSQIQPGCDDWLRSCAEFHLLDVRSPIVCRCYREYE